MARSSSRSSLPPLSAQQGLGLPSGRLFVQKKIAPANGTGIFNMKDS